MKRFTGRAPDRLRRGAAFTLIELLTVMAIILILAGLILHIAGSAQYKAATSRATSEIHALEVALESYKTDNGAYPQDSTTISNDSASYSGMLNPQTDFDPTNSKYTNNSEYIYQLLSGFPPAVGAAKATGTTMTKAYFTFKPQQLQAVSSTDPVSPTNPGMYIVDPFGFSYGYSTVYSAYVAQQTASANGTNTPNTTYGYNPTFDLWSTAGYAPGGKSTPSNTPTGGAPTTPAAVYSNLWIKNW